MDGQTGTKTEAPPTAAAVDRGAPRAGGGAVAWLVASGAVLCVCSVLYFGRELFIPIALAILFWFLINAVAKGLVGAPEAPRMSSGLATVLAVLTVLALVAGAAQVVASNASDLGRGLVLDDSALISRLREQYEALGLAQLIAADEFAAQLPLGEYITATFGYLKGLLSDASLVFLYVLFLLLDQRYFDDKLKVLVSDESRRDDLSRTLVSIANEARTYLWLMFLISLGVGGATFIFCKFFGVNGAAFWGFAAFILNFIPTLGSIAAVLIPCLYALMTLDDPIMLGGLIACLAATQFIAGEVVLPRVMGRHLNLSSFVILFALVFWGLLWGPVGMFLAIPVTVILMSVCARFPAGRPVAVLLSKDGRLPSQ